MADGFVAVLKPRSEVELAFAIATLNAQRIQHFVHNGHFGALYVGMRIALYNQRTIFVPEENATDAIEALDGLDGRGRFLPWRSAILDRTRVLSELLLFGWCVPGASARVRPLRALALALMTSIGLSLVPVALLVVLGLVGSWWAGLNSGRTLQGAASMDPFERPDPVCTGWLRSVTHVPPAARLGIG